jgi:hypothetical protein
MLPYWVPFHLKTVGVHLLECRPPASILEHLFQKLYEVTKLDVVEGPWSRILESAVLPSRVNVFLERSHLVG